MKKISAVLSLLTSLAFVPACSSSDGGSGSVQPGASPQALPTSWYQNSNSPTTVSAELETPSPQAAALVDSTFRTHAEALEATVVPNDSSPATPMTPWHLDAVRTDFSISTSGIFGFLLLNGTTTVRGTWQKVKTPAASPVVAKAKKAKVGAVHFTTTTQSSDINGMLDPVVSVAVATKSVSNPQALRSQLQAKAQQFYTLTQALASAQPANGWQVTGAELELTVDASGNVTPVVGVGGEIDIYFDWNLSGAPTTPVVSSPLIDGLNQIVHVMSQGVTDAIDINKDLKASGFALSDYYVGVELTGSEDIGIVTAGEAATAKLYFTQVTPPVATASAVSDSISTGVDSKMIKLIGPAKSSGLLARTLSSAGLISKSQVASVSQSTLRHGLKHALGMGAFFVRHAVAAHSSHWKLNILETEFDLSLGGSLTNASVTGTGIVVMDFTPSN